MRELKRQIASLYYERTGFSTDKETLVEHVQSKSEQAPPRLEIRDTMRAFLETSLRETRGA